MAFKHLDNCTLYVKSGVAYNHQLTESVKKAVVQASKLVGKPLEVRFKVNLITLRDEKQVGYGYLRVTNPIMYHLLCGRNPDGTERVEYIDDPDWVAPKEITIDYSLDAVSNWADIEEEEELKERPKIKRVLPPLITLEGYKLDDKQKINYVKQVIDDAKRAGIYKEGTVVVAPEVGTFETSGAYVDDLEDNLCPNVLCARKVPQWVTEKTLKSLFTPYASDSTTKTKRRVSGQIIQDTYPQVTINSDRIAFITFAHNHDAQFCLLMTRRADIIDIQDTKKTVMLFFTHSFRTKGCDM